MPESEENLHSSSQDAVSVIFKLLALSLRIMAALLKASEVAQRMASASCRYTVVLNIRPMWVLLGRVCGLSRLIVNPFLGQKGASGYPKSLACRYNCRAAACKGDACESRPWHMPKECLKDESSLLSRGSNLLQYIG